MKTDLYNKVTDQIVSSLEQGVRLWMQPWSAEHAARRITRPLRGNGIPYQGINGHRHGNTVEVANRLGCRHGSALLSSSSLPVRDHPARDLAVSAFHAELPRC